MVLGCDVRLQHTSLWILLAVRAHLYSFSGNVNLVIYIYIYRDSVRLSLTLYFSINPAPYLIHSRALLDCVVVKCNSHCYTTKSRTRCETEWCCLLIQDGLMKPFVSYEYVVVLQKLRYCSPQKCRQHKRGSKLLHSFMRRFFLKTTHQGFRRDLLSIFEPDH